MNIGWPDLPGALLMLAAGVMILAGLIGLAIWDARRRRSPAVVVDVAGAIARVWVAFAGVGAVLTAWRWLTPGDVWIAGVPAIVRAPGLSCESAESPVDATVPTLVCATADAADLTVAGIGAGLRIIFLTSDLLAVVVAAVPGVILAIACSQALKGAPFSRVVSRWLLIGAVAVLVAGLGAELLGSMARTILANDLFPVDGVAVASPGVYYVSLSFWPIGAAIALGALGVIFRYGERLQRETEGLV